MWGASIIKEGTLGKDSYLWKIYLEEAVLNFDVWIRHKLYKNLSR